MYAVPCLGQPLPHPSNVSEPLTSIGRPHLPAQAKPASGRITTSGAIVTGYDTKFLSELKVHDAIIVQHPTT